MDHFAAALSEAIYPVRVDRADPEAFHAEVSVAHLGVIGVCKSVGSPHRSLRGRAELARTITHSFNLAMTLEASWTADHRGPLQLLPRDVVIVDSQYPIRADLRESFVAINVAVSEPWLRQWLPNPNVLAARRISRELPLGAGAVVLPERTVARPRRRAARAVVRAIRPGRLPARADCERAAERDTSLRSGGALAA